MVQPEVMDSLKLGDLGYSRVLMTMHEEGGRRYYIIPPPPWGIARLVLPWRGIQLGDL